MLGRGLTPVVLLTPRILRPKEVSVVRILCHEYVVITIRGQYLLVVRIAEHRRAGEIPRHRDPSRPRNALPSLRYVDSALLAQRKEPFLSYLATNMFLSLWTRASSHSGPPAPEYGSATERPRYRDIFLSGSSASLRMTRIPWIAQIPFPSIPSTSPGSIGTLASATLTTHSRSPMALYLATNRDLATEVNMFRAEYRRIGEIPCHRDPAVWEGTYIISDVRFHTSYALP